jgi:hypothetical protein
MIGFGFLEMTLLFLLTSPRTTQPAISLKGIVAFKKVVAPARAILGVGAFEIPPSSRWSRQKMSI